MRKSTLLLLGAATASMVLSAGAQAQDGAALYAQKTCIACHGVGGNKPILPTYPKIAGQNAEYLYNQMVDIKSGARNNGQTAAMKGVMHLVNEGEMKVISEWLATLPGVGVAAPVAPAPEPAPAPEAAAEPASAPEPAPAPEVAAEPAPAPAGADQGDQVAWDVHGGEIDAALNLEGNKEDGRDVYEVCSACHLPEGWGTADGTFPQLAGQHYKYIVRQFEWIRDGKRRNANLDMVKQIQEFSDQDMKMVINWVSRQLPPKELLAPSPDWLNPNFE
jgi:cytochrome c